MGRCIPSSNSNVTHNKLLAVEPLAPPPVPQPERLGVAEHVEQLRSSILSKTDAIRELRSRLRTTCVPLCICTYLSQCIKDTDVCIVGFYFQYTELVVKKVVTSTKEVMFCPLLLAEGKEGKCRDLTCSPKAELKSA